MRVALQALVDEFKAREGEGPYDSYHFLLIGPGGRLSESFLRIDIAEDRDVTRTHATSALTTQARELIDAALRQ